MSRRPVVVDGSNLATEGRSLPSLAQLDEAVRAWLAENPDDEVIVVVDASFGYRIDESERKMFEEAEEAGEVVSPPAGAVGRGDGFLLRIADRVDAAVLSNDSFQEFHGDYPWLFDSGRLLGGKPVPGVGWIFTPRTPVRGPKSRMAVRDAKRSTKPARSEPVVEAIAEATAEALEPEKAVSGRRGRRRAGGRPAASTHEAINDPLPFITFIAEHRLGTEVEGEVDGFTSHGAFVVADGARCYVPVSGLGDPPPRTAKAVLKKGETRRFVVQALDPPRRGIELALPGLARVAGAPTEETVEAEIAGSKAPSAGDGQGRRRRRRGSRVAAPAEAPAEAPVEAAPLAPALVEAGGSQEAPVPSVDSQPGEGEPAAASASDAAVEPPPPARRRRTTKKAGAEVPSPVDAEAAAPPPRARRSTKKAAPEPADAVEAAPVAEPAVAAAEPAAAEARPAPRRRAAKKAAAVEPSAAAEPPPEDAKPAAPRRRSTKRAAAQPPAAETPAAETPAAETPAAETPAAETPAVETPAVETPAAETPADEAKPAARRRRSTKKATADAAAEAAAQAPAADEAKPAASRRRATKKASTEIAADQAGPGESAAETKPRRATKKAAPAKKAAARAEAADGEPAPGEGQPPPARRRRTSKAGG